MNKKPSNPFQSFEQDMNDFLEPDRESVEQPREPNEQPQGPREQSRTEGAYSARESDFPPYEPGGSGLLGGLLFEPEARKTHTGQGQSAGTDIDDDTLRAMCQMRVCPDCSMHKEAEEARLRAMAEIDNAKKRMGREREEQTRFAAQSILSDIIPSLDNLDLALQHAGNNEACTGFVSGVEMTRNLLLDALKKHGLTAVGAVGEKFDPALHEAVGMTDVPEVPHGYVCNLLSRGYTLRDRLLRPARVMVCQKGQ